MKHSLEIFLAVHIVNHSNIDIVCLQSVQQILKGAFGFFNITGSGVLLIFINGTKMTLYQKFFSSAFESCSQMITGWSLRHKDIDIVDTVLFRCIYNTDALLFA